MKKSILIIILIISIFSGCSTYGKYYGKVRVIDCNIKPFNKTVTIKKKDIVEEMKEILNSISYIEDNLKLNNENYKIFLVDDNSEEWLFNVEVWVENDCIIVFDNNKGNYGYVDEGKIMRLKEILTSNSKHS